MENFQHTNTKFYMDHLQKQGKIPQEEESTNHWILTNWMATPFSLLSSSHRFFSSNNSRKNTKSTLLNTTVLENLLTYFKLMMGQLAQSNAKHDLILVSSGEKHHGPTVHIGFV